MGIGVGIYLYLSEERSRERGTKRARERFIARQGREAWKHRSVYAAIWFPHTFDGGATVLGVKRYEGIEDSNGCDV